MEKQDKQQNQISFKLPQRIITTVDLMRTLRELKLLDDWLNQAALRSGGAQVSAPKTSATLEEVASLNSVSLLDSNQRQKLIAVLDVFSLKAPKIHMSFAVEPSANFLAEIIVWLRANVNPMILVNVGLQPALTAGCSVRTTNKFFDMSLRNRFVDSRHFLVEAIEEFSVGQPATAPAQPAPDATAPLPASAEQPVEATAQSTSPPEVKAT